MGTMIDLKRQDTTAVAWKTLQEFSASGTPLGPPIPIDKVALWLGFQVVFLFSVGDACSALVSTREKLIGINGRHHRHRQRFSLGHEIAHILLKHPPERRCTAKQIAQFNREADECASELLIPRSLLDSWLLHTRNTAALARVFDVSEEAMAVKLKREARTGRHVAQERAY